jgi:hypothetical protein
MTLNQRIYDADQAKLVLENEAFQRAFEDIKQEITEQWMQSPARDEAGRQSLWQMLKMLEKVRLCLQASLDSGKLAAKELEYQNSLAKKVKEWAGVS